MDLKFRPLNANEIDCRVAVINLPSKDKEGGLSLLLYKDARVDQNILDETVGPMNWQRRHTRDNANCIVSLWDEDKKQWIEKEDTGTESNTEAEKGLASDSFKRACFNWGIGRELYTAPFVWVPGSKCNIFSKKTPKGDVGACRDRFYVAHINSKDGQITQLVICNGSKGNQVVFSKGVNPEDIGDEPKPEPKPEPKEEPKPVWKLNPMTVKEIEILAERAGVNLAEIKRQANIKSIDELSDKAAEMMKKALNRKIIQRRSNGGEGQTD